jgi:hypothetical protein
MGDSCTENADAYPRVKIDPMFLNGALNEPGQGWR